MTQEEKSFYFNLLETILKNPKNKFGNVKNIEKITPHSRINEDLGLDSLDSYKLIFLIEKQTGIAIEDEQTCRLKSVKDFEDYLTNNSPRKTY